MERVHSTGAVRVAHELVDVAAPGLLGVVTGRGLKGGKDGREEGRGRRRHSPLTFPKAGKKRRRQSQEWRPPYLCQQCRFSPEAPLLPAPLVRVASGAWLSVRGPEILILEKRIFHL